MAQKSRKKFSRAEAVLKAIDHASKPLVIFRDDTNLFGILLAEHLASFGIKCDPETAWLALADAYVEYSLIKERAAEDHPEKVIKNAAVADFIATPLETVFTSFYLNELEEKGWLPKWLVEKRRATQYSKEGAI
jgi:hypothetical protein